MTNWNKHYCTIFVLADCPEEGEPVLKEPHSCEGWQWVTWQELMALSQPDKDEDAGHWLPKKELEITGKELGFL